MPRTPADPAETLTEAFTRLTASPNVVPLLVDALLVTALGACTLGILFPPLMLGYAGMCLAVLRGETVRVGQSFDGMKRFGAALTLGLLVLGAVLVGALAVGLGSLVAGFVLSFVFFVQADRPELGAFDVATESFRIVRANLLPTLVIWGVGAGLGTLLSATVVGGVAVFAYTSLLTALTYQRARTPSD